MKIVICTATGKEILPFKKLLIPKKKSGHHVQSFSFGKHNIDLVVTGAGMISTTYYLARVLPGSYDFAINAGIAGSFKEKYAIGSVVNVTEDMFSEMGAENDQKFVHAGALNIGIESGLKNKSSIRNRVISRLQKVKGVTVNCVHGNRNSIRKVKKRLNPDVESMEGAAFLYVCSRERIPCAQIRAISNYVEKRNVKKWNIPLAVANLNKTILKILESFNNRNYSPHPYPSP